MRMPIGASLPDALRWLAVAGAAAGAACVAYGVIVERRDRKPFASVDEIGRIKGMRALVQRLRARLAVQGDTTLRPLRP